MQACPTHFTPLHQVRPRSSLFAIAFLWAIYAVLTAAEAPSAELSAQRSQPGRLLLRRSCWRLGDIC